MLLLGSYVVIASYLRIPIGFCRTNFGRNSNGFEENRTLTDRRTFCALVFNFFFAYKKEI